LQDITQAGQAQGGLIDTTNVTSKGLVSGLITIAVKGSKAIFERKSASSFFIDIEQLSVMHFLDSTRFASVIGLIRSNSAYSVQTNPATGRPHIVFSQATLQACGTTGLSCILKTNIYNKLVNQPSAVHTLSTGIGTTSLDQTTAWLTRNVLKSTDEFSMELAENMTSLVRSFFGINDRSNKAWFVSPGNNWIVPNTGGAQSNLLLSDKLIMFAVITLNDNAGNILRRRLMSFSPSSDGASALSTGSIEFHEDREHVMGRRALLQNAPADFVTVSGNVPSVQSDDSIVKDAMKKMIQEPRVGTLPPIEYSVDVPLTVATIFEVEQKPYALLSFDIHGRFDDQLSSGNYATAIGDEFFRRLSTNLDKICASCEAIFPVFNNAIRVRDSTLSSAFSVAGRRRNLLQANTTSTAANSTLVSGTYTVLLVYDKNLVGKPIYYADISKAVYSSSYTPVWTGASDPASIQNMIDSLASQHFIVRRLDASGPTQ
jgi:hypothetical protein